MSKTRIPRRRFVLEIRDAGKLDDVDVINRLKAVLKSMLRAHAIQCTSIREVDAAGRALGLDGAPTGEPIGLPENKETPS